MGISRGRVQQGNEREGWDSSELIQGPLWQCGEPHTMHGCAIATETPPLTTAMECKEGREKGKRLNLKEPSSTTSQSGTQTGSYITLNRPGLYSSCLERVC